MLSGVSFFPRQRQRDVDREVKERGRERESFESPAIGRPDAIFVKSFSSSVI